MKILRTSISELARTVSTWFVGTIAAKAVGSEMDFFEDLLPDMANAIDFHALLFCIEVRNWITTSRWMFDYNEAQCTLRWDTGNEKISSFARGGAYAHRSSLDKYFSKISQ